MKAADAILSRILTYARARWCWDDQSMLTELYERLYADGDTPEAFVDQLAEDYDLLDPRDYQLNLPENP